ncbi:uncharacterized protein EI90DRAFT_3114642 [Cantharellus anzutake]|uniref:uncharacterized protein n=1 Tax=Cantharellus anzutake TaxID=1750568 RepID=UPI0019049AC0|nr:uncharacterized protein EI90DRAFT_3114642 [Cantharellus anzutake]KAF8344010.1 hypothetical protein EI90DRAFT_3114642 [Cantharellus anzutake]
MPTVPEHQGDQSSTNILDHLVHFASPGQLNRAIGEFESSGFKLSRGTHADGCTHNALVVFADGVYLELISFTHEVSDYPEGSPERSKRESHWWADQNPGGQPVPTKLSTHPSGNGSIQEREKNSSRPPNQVEDVPLAPPSNTSHPNGALGIAQIIILVPSSDFTLTSNRLSATLGVSTTESATQNSWPLKTPRKTDHPSKLVLKATDSNQFAITEVKFWVVQGSTPPPSRTAAPSVG